MMKTIHISKIFIPANRQRQEFDPEALMELATSIEKRLFHALVLRQPRVGDNAPSGHLVLVAGERRLRAIRDLWALGQGFIYDGQFFPESEGFIPYVSLGDLDELSAEEAELDENLRRRDLTWQEHATALQRLHTLRSKQKAAAGETTQTVADTAEEVTGRRDGYYQDSVRRELIVAKHLDNPLIAKAKTVDDAFKLLKADSARQKNEELAALMGDTFTSSSHTILNLDCLDWMQEYLSQPSPNLFDVIVTDPPYGMGADQFRDGAGKLKTQTHTYDDSLESWRKLMKVWCGFSFTITKPQAHAYVFCDIDNFHELKAMMQDAGWYVFRTPFTYHKINSGRVPLPDCGPRRVTEWILYAIKGKKPVTHIYPDLIACQADDMQDFGAAKPVALYQNLLQRSVAPGDYVLDTFAGTGPVIEAGHTLKCFVTAIELDASRYAICTQRLSSITAQKELPNV